MSHSGFSNSGRSAGPAWILGVVGWGCVALGTGSAAHAEGRVTEYREADRTIVLEFEDGAAIRLNQPLVVIVDGRYVGKVTVSGLSGDGRTGKARLIEGTAASGGRLLTAAEFFEWREKSASQEADDSEASLSTSTGPMRGWLFQVQAGLAPELGAELLQGGLGLGLSISSRDRRGSGWELRASSLSSRLHGDVTTQTNLGPLTVTYDEPITIRPLTLGWSWHLSKGFSLGFAVGAAQFAGSSGGASFYAAGAVPVTYEQLFSRSFFFSAGIRPTYVHASGNELFSKAVLVESGVGVGVKF